MLSLARRFHMSNPFIHQVSAHQLCQLSTGTSSPSHERRRRPKLGVGGLKKANDKSEWWVVDGEMHEIGENVAPRERFVIARDNIPNKRRKQLREQFMRRTRLVFKESEHEPWCKRYMELYQELRENWERLYWDEGYSKKLAQDHANYDSGEDDDKDFSPYRAVTRPPHVEQRKEQGMGRSTENGSWEKVNQIRDKFEYDRERRMRERAFAPMSTPGFVLDSGSKNRPLETRRYFPQSERS